MVKRIRTADLEPCSESFYDSSVDGAENNITPASSKKTIYVSSDDLESPLQAKKISLGAPMKKGTLKCQK